MIEHVLLDADGVVQRVGGAGWRSELDRRLGGRVDEFIARVSEQEEPSLRGVGDFPEGVRGVLGELGLGDVDAEELYTGVWLTIEPLPQVLSLVDDLRAAGRRAHLVTNQHPRRARFMETHLGYDGHFDECFYSCDLGAAKPQGLFFERVLERLGTTAERVVFVDDNAVNVEAAGELGIPAHRWHHEDGVDELRGLLAGHGR